MSKYRAKPYEIEAVQWTGDNLEEIKLFFGEKLKKCSHHITEDKNSGKPFHFLALITSFQEFYPIVGDYIIKGMTGEFYICIPSIFEIMYEVSGLSKL